MRSIGRYLYEERRALHLRMALVKLVLAPLPLFFGGLIRAVGLRAAGFQIGRGTTFFGTPEIVGQDHIYQKLIVGKNCIFGPNVYLDLADTIQVGDESGIAQEVMMITGTHDTSDSSHRLGRMIPKPICIGKGVWVSARCMILPGVTIGDGAIVAAGSVVNRDVPPHTLVAGVPAVVKRQLDE